jgi:hypothetical protein
MSSRSGEKLLVLSWWRSETMHLNPVPPIYLRPGATVSCQKTCNPLHSQTVTTALTPYVPTCKSLSKPGIQSLFPTGPYTYPLTRYSLPPGPPTPMLNRHLPVPSFYSSRSFRPCSGISRCTKIHFRHWRRFQRFQLLVVLWCPLSLMFLQ